MEVGTPASPPGAGRPPARVRRRFLLLGTRVAPQWRPWVAEQITAPGYLRRQLLRNVAVGSTVYVGLQLALGSDLLRWELLAAYAFGTLVALPLVLRRQDGQVSRLLAHHGVTADGRVVQPVSYWSGGLFTRWTAPLLAAVLLVLAVGVTYVISHQTSPMRCQDAPASGVEAVQDVLGMTQLPGGPQAAPLFEGARLAGARRVDAGLDGIYYLGAYVEGLPEGFDTGPAVWRVIEPDSTFDLPTRDVSAVNATARSLTPVTGSSSNSPDPTLDRVLECVQR